MYMVVYYKIIVYTDTKATNIRFFFDKTKQIKIRNSQFYSIFAFLF